MILRPRRLEELLGDVRKKGYGYRYGEPPKESGAIAVPILSGDRSLSCVNMTFMAATLTFEEAASKHLSELRECAEAIAHGTQQLESATSGRS